MWAQQLVSPYRFEELEAPSLESEDLTEGEVLLRVRVGGICGSDLPYFRGALHRPDDPTWELRPGFPLHEVGGDVLASRDPRLDVGAAVVGWASGFNAIAELVITTGDGLHAYDRDLPSVAAIVAQPLACALYALEQVSPVSGRHVTVLGQGAMGLLFSHVLKTAGAASVTGVDRVDRSDVASAFGVDRTVHASVERWAQSAAGDPPDLVIEAIGHQVGTLSAAISAVRHSGEIFYFGVPDDEVYPIPLKSFLRKNLTLRSGVTLERARMLRAAIDYIRTYPELPAALVTHVMKATDAQAAFTAANNPRSGQLKIVLEMD